jgi:hypothetical protein
VTVLLNRGCVCRREADQHPQKSAAVPLQILEFRSQLNVELFSDEVRALPPRSSHARVSTENAAACVCSRCTGTLLLCGVFCLRDSLTAAWIVWLSRKDAKSCRGRKSWLHEGCLLVEDTVRNLCLPWKQLTPNLVVTNCVQLYRTRPPSLTESFRIVECLL